MKGRMKVHYDTDGDFLEISIGNPTECIATEVRPGVFVRTDKETKEIRSIGLVNFRQQQEFDLPVVADFTQPRTQ